MRRGFFVLGGFFLLLLTKLLGVVSFLLGHLAAFAGVLAEMTAERGASARSRDLPPDARTAQRLRAAHRG